MKTVQLGRTGLRVSEVALGTMTFGAQSDAQASYAIMDIAEEAGVTFIDTADMYPIPSELESVGRSEELVGEWLSGKRDRFVVATKCFAPMGPGPNDRGNSRRHMIRACEASLRRLGTDYIDLYQIHQWDPTTPIDETLETMDDLRTAGKIRYAGCSNVKTWQLMHALWTSDLREIVRFDSVQPRYNLLYREIEREMFPVVEKFGVGVMAYNPLAGGVLTGKYHRGDAPREGTRFRLGASGETYQRRYFQDVQLDVVERLSADVASRGKSITHVALAWVLRQPQITCAIVGASKPEQLRDSLNAVDVVLDEQDVAACDAAWYALPRRPEAEER